MKASPIAVYTDYDELDITPGRQLLESHGWTVRVLGTRDSREILEGAQDADALMVGYARIDADLIRALPRLKIIALLSMGVDNVDVDAATDSRVWVANVPGVATREVAAHALALALNLCRQVSSFGSGVRQGQWSLLSSALPKGLHETRVGVLGYGKIGRAFGALAAAVFDKVLAYDPLVTELTDKERAAGIELAGVEEVLAQADVLSLHMPLTQDPRHFLDEAMLDLLPDQAVVVNVSRGELIDEDALLRSLRSGRVRGAALDVLSEEPAGPDHPLVRHPRVVVTPHIGFLSDRTFVEYPMIQARNVLAWSKTGRPETPVRELSPLT